MLHPELPSSAKQALFLNVLFKAMKSDANPSRVAALGKRLLQACVHAPPSFICGALLLLQEVAKAHPSLGGMFGNKSHAPATFDDSAPAADSAAGAGEGEGGYDWTKRDPAHARAETSRLWEVEPLCAHFHPSVSQFATNLRNGTPIHYAVTLAPTPTPTPPPLRTHTHGLH